MTAVIFVPQHNAPGKRDVTHAFLPEATAFLRLHGGSIHRFDNSKTMWERRRWCLERLEQLERADVLAFFCHGFSNRIQAGFAEANLGALAEHVERLGIMHLGLFCCSTASKAHLKRGFAVRLAEACPWVNVDAHTTAGHTTWNPHKLRISAGDSGPLVVHQMRPPVMSRRDWADALKDQEYRLSLLTKPQWRIDHEAASEEIPL